MADLTVSHSFHPSTYMSPNTVSSSCISNGEIYTESPSSTSPEICSPEVQALHILSQNINALLSLSDFDCSDAQITVEERVVPVHRCILGARSPYFRRLFSATSGREPLPKFKYELGELLREWKVGYEVFMVVLGYMYSGKIKEPPARVCTCVDATCSHDACRPAIDFALELLYCSYVFQIPELVSLSQRHMLSVVEKAQVEDVIPILAVANACQTGNDQLLSKCIEIVSRSDLDSTALEKGIPQQVAIEIFDIRSKLGLGSPDINSLQNKNVKRIQRALESDDVELVRMLLNEGPTTLDDAYALHYAAAYCDSKTTTELLDLGNSDINLRNNRGYTVLHIAAMRKEPAIIVALLTKGAHPSDETLDGRNALQISRRLTRAIDYNSFTETGKESPKDRLCIEILEQAERRDPLLGDASLSLALAGDDLRMKLLYLENRVALARLLFPFEAKVAMDIAHVDGTSEFTDLGASNLSSGIRKTTVDLNETPIAINIDHLSRMEALLRTVELGKRFFPRCSRVLNKLMDDDISEFTCLEKGTSEEQRVKRQRYDELKDTLSEAFSKDKEEFEKSGMSSSSSSSSIRDGHRQKIAKNVP
eukprot:Gb_08411 [translate_table: standard]